jgi:hypothetical protein
MKTIKLLLTDEQEKTLIELTNAWNEYIQACGGTGVIEMEIALALFVTGPALREETEKRREMTFIKRADNDSQGAEAEKIAQINHQEAR